MDATKPTTPTRRFVLHSMAAGCLLVLTGRSSSQAQPRVIDIVARKFEFVPAEIHVKRGETVLLQLSAPEVPMGFKLVDFGLRTDILPQHPVTLSLTPQRSGSFPFLCDLFCGSGHEDMNGVLIVD